MAQSASKAFLEPFTTPIRREERVEGGGPEAVEFDLAQLRELLVVEQRVIEPDHAAALRPGLEEIAFGSEEGLRRGDELFTDTVERRVRDLRENLFKILIEVLRLLREHREGRVVAHRGYRLHASGGGGPEEHAEILVGVAESELALEDTIDLDRFRSLRCGKILEENAVLVEPLLVGLRGVDALLYLVVGDDATFLHVHEEHAPRTQAAFFDDGERVEIRHDTHFGGHDDEVVLGHIITARAETVAVEHGTDLLCRL